MAKATATKPAASQQQPAPQKQNEVATIAPPRLPYHPAIQERFGVDKASWKVLCESIFPSARTSDSIVLALSYCKARRLDPFKRNIHIVPIYDSKKKAEVETVWPGIAELRTTAMRTKSFAGMSQPEFGPTITRKFKDSKKDGNDYSDIEVEVSFPEWCRITVNRIVQGNIVAFPGPTVVWLEFYNKKSRYVDAPNEQWKRRPSQMLEKCAEAGALRRAFPEEFGEDYTVEEIGAFGPLATSARPVDAEVVSTTSPTEPKRADFTPEKGRADPPHDGKTGEIASRQDEASSQQESADALAEQDDAAQEDAAAPKGKTWAIDAVGQDAKVKAFYALLDEKTETVDEVDQLVAAHVTFLDKLGKALRAEVDEEIAKRKAKLTPEAE